MNLWILSDEKLDVDFSSSELLLEGIQRFPDCWLNFYEFEIVAFRENFNNTGTINSL